MPSGIYEDHVYLRELLRKYSTPVIFYKVYPSVEDFTGSLQLESYGGDVLFKDYSELEYKYESIGDELFKILTKYESDEDLNLNIKLTKWFYHWSIELSYLVKLDIFKRYSIPLDIHGILIFINAHDDFQLLTEFKDKRIILVIISDEQDNSHIPEKLSTIFTELPKYIILYARDGKEGDEDKVYGHEDNVTPSSSSPLPPSMTTISVSSSVSGWLRRIVSFVREVIASSSKSSQNFKNMGINQHTRV